MKYNIISLNGFMYAVDKEARPKKDQWVFETHNPIVESVCQTLRDYTDQDNTTDKVIIFSNDPSLNLPLLPAVEEDVQQLVDNKFKGTAGKEVGIAKAAFIQGYKAASSKQYTEADVRKAFKAGRNWGRAEVIEYHGGSENENPNCDEYLQSLKPTPVAIEVEMVNKQKPINYHRDLWVDDFIPVVNENNFVKVNQWIYE